MLLIAGGSWLAGTRPAAGEGPGDDGVPVGAVAFFAGGACPSGWTVAENTRGRLVVGVTKGEHAGIEVGEPLGDQEDRKHHHAYSGEVVLPDKVLAAADGGNQSGAKAQSYVVAGTTHDEVSGLPFLQVQACVKQ